MKQDNIILDKSLISIASKEARETNYLNTQEPHVKSLKEDIEEIVKLLTSIIKSSLIFNGVDCEK